MSLSTVNHDEQVIFISVEEYQKLLNDSHFLECLKGCGVDNWDGYDDAYKMYESFR